MPCLGRAGPYVPVVVAWILHRFNLVHPVGFTRFFQGFNKQESNNSCPKPVEKTIGRRVVAAVSLAAWLFTGAAWAGEYTVYGPESFYRQSGSPVVEERQFNAQSSNSDYILRIFNGSLEDDSVTGEKVSSSVVAVNGTTVADQSNFNQNVSSLEIPLTLLSSNTLTAQLNGKPGGVITVSIVGIDNENPTITATLTPVANSAGWHQNSVEVTFNCSDAISGIASCSDTVVVSTEGANQVITGTAVDLAGNTSTTSVTVNLDTSAPIINATLTPVANTLGWHTEAVTITYTCSDALSGVANCPGTQTLTTSGANQSVIASASDHADNSASHNLTLNIDLEAPILSFISPAAGASLTNYRPTLTLNVSDNVILDTTSIQIRVNNQAIAHQCTYSAGTATCTLQADLPASNVNLQASARDAAGLQGQTSIQVIIDLDGDGVEADVDQCPNTPAGDVANADGCSPAQLDEDADGVNNTIDQCPATPAGETVDANGCSQTQLDDDADGINNALDQCPGTPAGETVDANGCAAAQLDADGDGVPNSIDQCPNTAPGTPVAADGCDDSQRDTDGDGVLDIHDAFPNDPSESNDLDGDGIGDNSDPDKDGDGVANEQDRFPTDPKESSDLDNDGIGDNADLDRDGDGVNNTGDAYPDDPTRSSLPIVTIDNPATLTTVGSTPIQVNGTVDPDTQSLTVNGVPTTFSGGAYSASVSLEEGHNTLVARIIDSNGTSSTASVSVSLDMTEPYVTVESHTQGQTVYSAAVAISGLVNDIVRGTVEAEQANVVVQANGQSYTATVANRSYLAENVTLVSGSNNITIQATDQVGNVGQTTLILNYQPPVGQQLQLVSGQSQSATIGENLPLPLVVKVLDGNGQAVAAKPVVFRVTQGAGQVAAGSEGEASAVVVTTDAQGQAQTTFKVGQRVGQGNHKVRAQVVGYADEIIFHASATGGIGDKLSVNSGNNQRGAVFQPLPAPFVTVITDAGANVVKNAEVRFDVITGGGTFQNGNPSYTTFTDSDGRASAHLKLGNVTGLDQQRVRATLLSGPAGQTITAGFTASGFYPADAGLTSVSGLVMDNEDHPLANVTVRIKDSNRQALTDAQGAFTISEAPVGPIHLIVDGSTTTVPGEYPTLGLNLVTVAGVNNPLSAPVYMVKLNTANQVYVTNTNGGTVTLDDVPGFALTVEPGAATFPDGKKEGYLSVTKVNASKVPMAPPNGMQPQFIVTIQPTGAVFDPPAQLSLPNVDSHAPGSQVEMYSYDHDLEEFVAIGLGTVSADGTVISSNPGVGVVKAGWHCGSPPGGSGTTTGGGTCDGATAECSSQQAKPDNCEGDGSQATTGSNVSDTTCGTNPIDITTGTKYQQETDYIGSGNFPLRLERHYNSHQGGWRHSYAYQIADVKNYYQVIDGQLYYNGQPVPRFSSGSGGGSGTINLKDSAWFTDTGPAPVELILNDGSNHQYQPKTDLNGNFLDEWESLTDPFGTLTPLPEGDKSFVYTNSRSTRTLYFNLEGRLSKIEYINGDSHTLTYPDGQTVVTDSLGNTLTLNYDQFGRLTTAQINSLTFTYTYDPTGKLIKVTYPDLSTRQYVYEDTRHPHHLTGIIDEAGIRYATWQYDHMGRGVLSEHAGGANRVAIRYNPIERRDLWDILGDVDFSTTTFSSDGNSSGSGRLNASLFNTLQQELETGSITVTNPLNKVTEYTFEKVHGQRKITQVQGSASANTVATSRIKTYNDKGQFETVTDREGNLSRFSFDELGRTTAVAYAEGEAEQRSRTTTWHPVYNKPQSITEAGITTNYTYYDTGLKKAQLKTSSVGNTTTTYDYYDNTGLLKSIDGPRTDVQDITNFQYDTQGRLTKVINALGHETRLANHNAWNLPEQITDANGVVTLLGYDARGRLTTSTLKSRDGDAITTFTLNPVGLIESVTTPTGVTLNYEYDNARRLIAIQDAEGNRIEYDLDPMGNQTAQYIKDSSGQLSQQHFWVYDELGRLIQDIGAEGQITAYQVSPNGNPETITDANDNTWVNAFDALNRLKTATDPDQHAATYAYDSRDNLKTVSDQRQLQTTYTYNHLDQVTQINSPDTGITNLFYDSAGNVDYTVDANNVTADYSYDALNRITTVTYSTDSSLNISYQYDQSNLSSTASASDYNAGIGRLTTMTDISGATNYKYDDRGNVHTENKTMTIAGQSKAFTSRYSYDLSDNLQSMTYPSGIVVSYQRNLFDQVEQVSLQYTDITQTSQTQTLASGVDYQAFGRINSLTWGNGLSLNRHFDQDGRLSQQQVSNAIQSLNFDYDNNGNILAITDLLTSANSGNYGYDALNRLKTETKGDLQNTFDYDPVGNRLNKASENTTTNTTDNQTLTYAISSNRLATKDGSTITYDNNGNTLQDGTKSWTYSARNRMSQFKLNGIVQADYQHNATGERVLKKHGSETIAYFYNGAGQLLNEIHYNNSGEQTAHTAYIWLGDMPLAVIKQNHSGGTVTHSQIAYIHSDHLNTPRIATDQTGQTLWQWQSTAFGEQAANEDVDGDGQLFTLNLRFPGQYYDQESGLNYNYFRDYDPTTGRYVQSDPIGLRGGLNTFAYVNGNPVILVDPKGEATAAIGVGTVGALVTASYCALFPSSPSCEAIGGLVDRCLDGLGDFVSRLPVLPLGGTVVPNPYYTESGESSNDDENSPQDKKLTPGEVEKLKEGGVHPHDLKDNSKQDLFKDKDGNIIVKPKKGNGPGDPTGLNINDF